MVLAGLRGKLERHVRTIEEHLRERLIFQDLYLEHDIAETDRRARVTLAMLPLLTKESVLDITRKQYASATIIRRMQQLDPFAASDTPAQAAARVSMGAMLDMLEKAGVMDYEEPSDAIKELHNG